MIKFAAEAYLCITTKYYSGDTTPRQRLKVVWRQVCHDFKRRNPGRMVTRFEFSQIFRETWYESMSAKNIISSYKTTSICPFNRHALNVPGMEEEKFTLFQPEKLVKKTGLKYIPLIVHPHVVSPQRILMRIIVPHAVPIRRLESVPQFKLHHITSQLLGYILSVTFLIPVCLHQILLVAVSIVPLLCLFKLLPH